MRTRSSRGGLTLVEVVVSTAVLGILSLGVLSFEVGAQRVYSDQQLLAVMRDQARTAVDRLVRDVNRTFTATVAGQDSGGAAATSELTTLWPDTGTDARGLLFREVSGGNSSGPIYGNTIVWAGPHTGTPSGAAASGVVRLRRAGLTPTSFGALGSVAGPDGVLGSYDDATSEVEGDGGRVVEVLVHAAFAPSSGAMLRVDLSGRVVTIALRLNYRRPDGTWLLPTDLTIDARAPLLR